MKTFYVFAVKFTKKYDGAWGMKRIYITHCSAKKDDSLRGTDHRINALTEKIITVDWWGFEPQASATPRQRSSS